jgi:type I restriction enzyme S subunit
MPNNWKTYKLSEITTVITKGTTPSTYGFGFIDKGVNFIKSESTNYDGRLDETVFVKVSEEAHNKLKRSQLEEDDILFSMAGAYLGKTGMIYKNHLPANTNQANGIIRVNKNKALPKFVSFLLRNPSLISYVNASAGQSAQPNINLTDIGNLEFKLPPLQEQQSIASILSSIDDKIENNLAINKTLEEMAMALYKHWFVDFGPFQDGEFVESELGMIPIGWEVKKICDVVSVIGGYAFKSKWFQETGIKVLKIKNINNNIVDISKCDCISETVSKSINPKFKVSKGDFLVAMTGAEVGKVGVVPNYHQDLWLNQRVGKFNDKEIKNASILIGKVMQTNDFYKIIQGLAYGSAQPNISTSDIENINIILPNDKNILNTLINDFVHLHNITIENLTENQTLTQLRDTLLPQLISGDVRLKEFRV